MELCCEFLICHVTSSAMIINGPGLVVLNVMTSLCGLVCYAYYRYCDPLNEGRIMASDQVMTVVLSGAVRTAS